MLREKLENGAPEDIEKAVTDSVSEFLEGACKVRKGIKKGYSKKDEIKVQKVVRDSLLELSMELGNNEGVEEYHRTVIADLKNYHRDRLYNLDYQKDKEDCCYSQEIISTINRYEESPTDEDEAIILSDAFAVLGQQKDERAAGPRNAVMLRRDAVLYRHTDEWARKTSKDFFARIDERAK